MIEDRLSLEDLLLATLDAVSRFRVGQRDTVGAALDAGPGMPQRPGPAATWGVGRLAASRGPGPTYSEYVAEAGRLGPNRRGRD